MEQLAGMIAPFTVIDQPSGFTRFQVIPPQIIQLYR